MTVHVHREQQNDAGERDVRESGLGVLKNNEPDEVTGDDWLDQGEVIRRYRGERGRGTRSRRSDARRGSTAWSGRQGLLLGGGPGGPLGPWVVLRGVKQLSVAAGGPQGGPWRGAAVSGTSCNRRYLASGPSSVGAGPGRDGGVEMSTRGLGLWREQGGSEWAGEASRRVVDWSAMGYGPDGRGLDSPDSSLGLWLLSRGQLEAAEDGGKRRASGLTREGVRWRLRCVGGWSLVVLSLVPVVLFVGFKDGCPS